MNSTGKQLAIDILQKLRCDTSGAIHPHFDGHIHTDFIILNADYPTEVTDALTAFLKALYPEQDDYYNRITQYVFQAEADLRRRERMHRIYKTEVSVPKTSYDGKVIGEQRFKLFDMSALKMQEQAGMFPDEGYYRNPPIFVKDIARFTMAVASLNSQDVYLLNPAERALLDLRNYELLLLPELDE